MTVRAHVTSSLGRLVLVIAGIVSGSASWLVTGLPHELLQGGMVLGFALSALWAFADLLHTPVVSECSYCRDLVPSDELEPLAGGRQVCERCLSTTPYPQRAA